MNNAIVKELIETQSVYGKGKNDSPSRIIRQYWEKDGTLLATADPFCERDQVVSSLSAEVFQLRNAVKWALGEGEEFSMRPPKAGAYWWRTELRRRAGME